MVRNLNPSSLFLYPSIFLKLLEWISAKESLIILYHLKTQPRVGWWATELLVVKAKNPEGETRAVQLIYLTLVLLFLFVFTITSVWLLFKF